MKWSILPATNEERAVSPVIGVIMMITVTVILAAVVSMLVLDMGQDLDPAPQANFAYDYDEEALIITHEGGDKIAAGELSIKVGNETAKTWAELTSKDPDSLVSSGDSVTNTTATHGNTVRVIWESNGDSAVLSRYTVP